MQTADNTRNSVKEEPRRPAAAEESGRAAAAPTSGGGRLRRRPSGGRRRRGVRAATARSPSFGGVGYEQRRRRDRAMRRGEFANGGESGPATATRGSSSGGWFTQRRPATASLGLVDSGVIGSSGSGEGGSDGSGSREGGSGGDEQRDGGGAPRGLSGQRP
ncbi:hypothetical protein Syun_022992 [Stephania yunnanensis]|uniref:Uncharacterized protein n=1 Tax=Stephania yunnanensis TaxID=152371 RepID=A0AAP0I343_9MAGN